MTPVYDFVADDETTNQALARLGYVHRSQGMNAPGHIYRLRDGKHVASPRTVFATNVWIRLECPDVDGATFYESGRYL